MGTTPFGNDYRSGENSGEDQFIDSNSESLLTQEGAEVQALYMKMKAEISGWWYSSGSFTFEMFLGLMLMHEAAGNLDWLTLIAQATAQQLFVGGNKDPYCASRSCMNGVFNFLAAYTQSIPGLVDIFVHSNTSIRNYFGYGNFALEGNNKIKQRLSAATEAGTRSLHPNALNYDRYNSPSDWANYDDINRELTRMGAQIGTGVNQVYYRSPDNVFYIMTAMQVNYWDSISGK
jgi:hypothetical protein